MSRRVKVYFIDYLESWHKYAECGEYLGTVITGDYEWPFSTPYCNPIGYDPGYYPGEEAVKLLVFNNYSGFSPGYNMAGGRNAPDPL